MQKGDYACVSVPWLKKKLFGLTVYVPNILGYLIRLFTWSRYDHAFIYIGNGKIIEAQPRGAVISDLTKYKYDKLQVSTTVLNSGERKIITTQAQKYIGTPYGFLDIFYLWLSILGFKWEWLLDKVESENRLICSQLVALCGYYASVDEWLCGKDNACKVIPKNLANLAAKATYYKGE